MKLHLQDIAGGIQFRVICETDEFCVSVGELGCYRGKWAFLPINLTAMMKDAARKELLDWTDSQVNLKNLTERILK